MRSESQLFASAVATGVLIFVFSALAVFLGLQSASAATERWVEPTSVAGGGDVFSGGVLVGILAETPPEEFSTCLDRLDREAALAEKTSWEWTECEAQPFVASCGPTECSGEIIPDGEVHRYTLYQITNAVNDVSQRCQGEPGVENPDNLACIQQAGCDMVVSGSGMNWLLCPNVMTPVGSLDVDMAKWQEEDSNSPVTESEFQSAGSSGTSRTVSSDADDSVVPGSWAARTVMSDVRLFGDPLEEGIRLGVTAGVCAVLIILVMLPTQLINSALEINRERLLGWFSRRQRTTLSPRKVPEWVWGIPVLFGASVLTGFADPGFGLNAMSVRLVLSVFLTFLLLNYVSTAIVWLILRGRESAALPTIRVHYLYLVVIVITVVATRLLNFQPALIFGIVLTIEATRVAKNAVERLAESRSMGRLQFTMAFVTIGMGLVGWLLFNATVWLPISSGAGESRVNHLTLVTIQEALGAFTVEALTTLPVLLLPLGFMPGGFIFRWSKSIWVATYGLALTLFFFILVPLPTSWGTVSTSFGAWLSGLVLYSLFAVVFWLALGGSRRRT